MARRGSSGGSGNGVAGAAASLNKVFTEFAASMSTLSTVMQKTVQTAFLPMTTALGTFEAACGKTVQTLKSLVEKANPAAALQFNRALDDLAGTMGQILTPVLEAVTGFIREQADVLQGMRTALDPVMKAFGSIISELSKAFLPIAELLLPAFQTMGFVINQLVVPALKVAVEVLTALADVAKRFGLATDIQKSSSVGAAVRPASYGKVEDIGKRTTLAALQSQAGNDPQKQALEEQKKANSTLNDIKSAVFRIANVGSGSGRALGREIGRLAQPLISIFD